jgi:hypothetical protein
VERDLEAAPALTVLVEELGVPEYTEDSRLEEDRELVSKKLLLGIIRGDE